MNEATLARPATILLALRDAEAQAPGGCSLARLRKLCDCRMSDLMRDLTTLAGGGWIAIEHDAQGAAGIRLSASGRLLCGTLAAQPS
ncbi:hypothetical protein [uncultured Massilia sp.]|uniref:hypothetical protein n=1 Tax=uncultured Massilia sp. TaxID=169973 RepID=UPI0025E16FF3|nr:hypothetical protein [uncultured Massilia sp.]